MIRVKATCRVCDGTGYSEDFSNARTSFCRNCKGMGVLILTAENWDIELIQGPKEELRKYSGFEDAKGEQV